MLRKNKYSTNNESWEIKKKIEKMLMFRSTIDSDGSDEEKTQYYGKLVELQNRLTSL